MPELPEVETIRRELAKILPGRKIMRVALRRENMLRGQSPIFFKKGLLQRCIKRVTRRGKFLLIRLDEGTLLMHLGMTGQVLWTPYSDTSDDEDISNLDKHIHLVLEFSDHCRLCFRDARMFGRFQLIDGKLEKKLFSHLGPEPLSRKFTAQAFKLTLKGRTASIKALLLSQRLVAGLGNIYVDESLFHAGIPPHASGGRLTSAQTVSLHAAIQKVIRAAIRRRGTSLSDYLDPRHRQGTFQLVLQVYGREGQPCFRCGTLIKKTIVSQRGTHWCPQCQKNNRRQ